MAAVRRADKLDCGHDDCTNQHLHMLHHGATLLGSDEQFTDADRDWHRSSNKSLQTLRQLSSGRNVGVVQFTAVFEEFAEAAAEAKIDCSDGEPKPRASWAEVAGRGVRNHPPGDSKECSEATGGGESDRSQHRIAIRVPHVFISNYPALDGEILKSLQKKACQCFPEWNVAEVILSFQTDATTSCAHEQAAAQLQSFPGCSLCSSFRPHGQRGCCTSRIKHMFCHSEQLMLQAPHIVSYIQRDICARIASLSSPVQLTELHIDWASYNDVCGVCAISFASHRDQQGENIYSRVIHELQQSILVWQGRVRIPVMVKKVVRCSGGKKFTYKTYASRDVCDSRMIQSAPAHTIPAMRLSRKG